MPSIRHLRRLFEGQGVIVAAHPDDEVIGAGAQLPMLTDVHFVHVTDGAPRDAHDARNYGFSTWTDYARARRSELQAALKLAGLTDPDLRELHFGDQQASWHLPQVVDAVEAALHQLRPHWVLTHPYEGGHPDHDATCFAVHVAVGRLKRTDDLTPQILEMTSYHNRNGRMATGVFLPRAECPVTTVALTRPQRDSKRRLFDCFATQKAVLTSFDLQLERFRPAPDYDFTEPPHPGVLFYEMFDWGITGELWRSQARSALGQVGNSLCA